MVLSGVGGGGGGEQRGRNEGKRWYGDGSKTVEQDGLEEDTIGTVDSSITEKPS